MNVQEYISSGLLENYVLGLVSDEERQEIERYATMYPEIRAELNAIEDALEVYALANAVSPPADMETRILNLTNPLEEKKVATSIASVRNFLIGGLVIALVGCIYLFAQQVQYQRQLQEKDATIAQLQMDYETLQQDCGTINTQIATLKDSVSQAILLKGTNNAPNASIIVHWNPSKRKALLGAINLPTILTDQQYQLWAIIDGQPTDMGVLDISTANALDDSLIEILTNFTNPQAFAITLEPKGGSAVPSLDKLYVIGNV
ncbi:MAG: anti-sigma factor [Saprospiraceae bacterium]|nr:anti-sigma factor [Saprospiraceae bacterium]